MHEPSTSIDLLALLDEAEVRADDRGRAPLRRRLERSHETSDCLLLPAGSRVSYRVLVPPSRPRLDTQLRVLGGSPEAAEVVVRIDGEVAAARYGDRRAGQEGEPWQVPLEEHAGRRVELELSLEGPEGAVGILTAPRLLGSGDARPAVVLVSLDTLRADHLGAYGDPRGSTPNIDRLAREGTVFERAVSPASYTLPTHVTVLTGQHPLVHGVTRRAHRIDPTRSEMLSERLRREGYATAGFTGGGYVNPAFGFSRGFDQYSTRDPAAWDETDDGRPPMVRVIDWMDRYRDQPYFLFVHTYLVHGYMPRQRYLDRVAPESGIDLDEPYEGPPRSPIHRRFKHLMERAEDGDESAAEALRMLYAATVAQADEEVVGPLLEAVARRAAAGGPTIVALFSDHGEEFLEHGGLGHGGALWGELVDVPWILRGPGIEPERRWRQPVGLVDVTPTILGLLGLSVPGSQSGRDRLEPGAATEPSYHVLHHELESGARWDGVVAPRWKLLRHQDGEALDWYLFDLDSDPGETTNRLATHPDVFTGMRARLQERSRRLLAIHPAAASSRSEESELPESLVRELRALGYVEQ